MGIIGLGYDTYTICCPYEAPVIAAWLEARSHDYRFCAVDIDPTILQDLQYRTHLLLPDSEYNLLPSAKSAWQRYLQRTEQIDQLETAPHVDGIVLSPYYQHNRIGKKQYDLFADHIHVARVPNLFDTHRRDGNMQFVCGDIADPHIRHELPQHDFVSIMNVLYHLSAPEQVQAFRTLQTIVVSHGFVLWNDKIRAPGQQIMEKPNGWLTPKRLREDFGFELRNLPPGIFSTNAHLMQKIA